MCCLPHRDLLPETGEGGAGSELLQPLLQNYVSLKLFLTKKGCSDP